MACRCQAPIAQGKAEAALAVTHLALLGVKRQERHAGITKEKKGCCLLAAAFCTFIGNSFGFPMKVQTLRRNAQKRMFFEDDPYTRIWILEMKTDYYYAFVFAFAVS